MQIHKAQGTPCNIKSKAQKEKFDEMLLDEGARDEKDLVRIMKIKKVSRIASKIKNKYYRDKHKILRHCRYLVSFIRLQQYRIQDHRKWRSLSGNKENLYLSLMKYDIISFDIFDTLITRTLYNPVDVFCLMEKELGIVDFSRMRVEAERSAIQKYDRDISLDDIYDEIKELLGSQKEQIKQLEINTEIKVMIGRKSVVDIYHRLISAGKTVYCVSDMYLPKYAIEKILKKCQIQLPTKMIISNCVNRRKDTMTMWPYMRDMIKGKSYIHVGDNFVSDFVNPVKCDISAAYIANSHFMTRHSIMWNRYRLFRNDKLGDMIIKGLLFNKKLFNSPFGDGSYRKFSLQDIGYTIYGPILLYFCLWLYQHAQREKYDGIFFFAREGYYLKPLYDKIVQSVYGEKENTYYFLTSRLAAATASFGNRGEIEEYLRDIPFDGMFSQLLKERFSLRTDVNGDCRIRLPKDIKNVLYRVEPYVQTILENAKKNKSLYQKYTKRLIFGYESKKIAVVDIGYSGTAQYYMSKAMEKSDLEGLYLYLGENVKPHRLGEKAYSCIPLKEGKWAPWMLMETVLTAPEPQFVGFASEDDRLSPVYRAEVITAEKKRQLGEVFYGVNQFVDDYLAIDERPSLDDLSISLALSLLQALDDGELPPKDSDLDFFSVDVAFDGAKRNTTLKID